MYLMLHCENFTHPVGLWPDHGTGLHAASFYCLFAQYVLVSCEVTLPLHGKSSIFSTGMVSMPVCARPCGVFILSCALMTKDEHTQILSHFNGQFPSKLHAEWPTLAKVNTISVSLYVKVE